MLIEKTYTINLPNLCENFLEEHEKSAIEEHGHEFEYEVCARSVGDDLDSIRVSEIDLERLYRWVMEAVVLICIRKFGQIIRAVDAEIQRCVNDPDTEADLILERFNLVEGYRENLECERKV
jgi:hypothetical protein